MLLPFPMLHMPLVQLLLSLPVMYIGATHFGKSAWGSVKLLVPNMDVLIVLGSGSAFIYSLAEMLLHPGNSHSDLYFETAATIVTLVLFGNVLEARSVKQTTSAIDELHKIQVRSARRISIVDGREVFTETPLKSILKGDILLVNTGDQIPLDGTILDGEALVDESMITGESVPVEKQKGFAVIGGTLLVNGTLRMQVDKVGEDTVLAGIIRLVKTAQKNKPNIQKLGDRVSAIFVPVVLAIAIITFLISWLMVHLPVHQALMSSIAVLVIACPCAMGLATPTAVMVGIGRAAKNGILIKGGNTVEAFANIKTIVFDKTGTLTTGAFTLQHMQVFGENEALVRQLVYSLEMHSSHPIAKSLVKALEAECKVLPLMQMQEHKGIGISAKDAVGNTYQLGSYRLAKHLTEQADHSLYLVRNDVLLATLDLMDEVKQQAKETIAALRAWNIRCILLSGDTKAKCDALASALGIDEVHSEQHPDEKLKVISKLASAGPTAMVGDGINDAPALAMATVGVSMGESTQAAIQSAQVILLNGQDLSSLVHAISISRHTLLTIKQNLFWAFFYNCIAIPVAAAGLLNPMIGALAMAFSDVFVIGNSIRLKYKNLNLGKH
jgi:Cu+-exporting ATPase